MWQAIFEALAVGVRVTLWLFTSIFRAIGDTTRWIEDRNNGNHRPFPVSSVLWGLISISVLIGWFVLMASQ